MKEVTNSRDRAIARQNGGDDSAQNSISHHPNSLPIFCAIQKDADTPDRFYWAGLISSTHDPWAQTQCNGSIVTVLWKEGLELAIALYRLVGDRLFSNRLRPLTSLTSG